MCVGGDLSISKTEWTQEAASPSWSALSSLTSSGSLRFQAMVFLITAYLMLSTEDTRDWTWGCCMPSKFSAFETQNWFICGKGVKNCKKQIASATKNDQRHFNYLFTRFTFILHFTFIYCLPFSLRCNMDSVWVKFDKKERLSSKQSKNAWAQKIWK